MKKFIFVKHTADVKFLAYGKTMEKVFENSVLATSEILAHGKKIKMKKIKTAKISGKDNESLLYNLIEEMIYLFDAKCFVVAKSKIKFDEAKKKIIVEFFGDDVKKYKLTNQIKAVTYHEMSIRYERKKWTAQVVLDI